MARSTFVHVSAHRPARRRSSLPAEQCRVRYSAGCPTPCEYRRASSSRQHRRRKQLHISLALRGRLRSHHRRRLRLSTWPLLPICPHVSLPWRALSFGRPTPSRGSRRRCGLARSSRRGWSIPCTCRQDRKCLAPRSIGYHSGPDLSALQQSSRCQCCLDRGTR